MIIYSAKNVLTQKIYIGSSAVSLQARKWRHESRSRDWKIDRPMYRDMRRLGTDTFEWQTIMHCESKEEMLAYEAEIIDLLETNKLGYNVARDGGSNSGGHSSDATRKKLSIARAKWWADNPYRKPSRPRGPFRPIMEVNKAAVLEMREKGSSHVEIGAFFGCSPSTVCCAVRRWKKQCG